MTMPQWIQDDNQLNQKLEKSFKISEIINSIKKPIISNFDKVIKIPAEILQEIYNEYLRIIESSNLFDISKIVGIGSTRKILEKLPGAKDIAGDIDLLIVGKDNFSVEQLLHSYSDYLTSLNIENKVYFGNIVSAAYYYNNEYVQIDLMICASTPNDINYKYLKDLRYFNDENFDKTPELKGLHRTELIRSLIKIVGLGLGFSSIKAYCWNNAAQTTTELIELIEKHLKKSRAENKKIALQNLLILIKKIKFKTFKSSLVRDNGLLKNRFYFSNYSEKTGMKFILDTLFDDVTLDNIEWTEAIRRIFKLDDSIDIHDTLNTFENVLKFIKTLFNENKISEKDLFFLFNDYKNELISKKQDYWNIATKQMIRKYFDNLNSIINQDTLIENMNERPVIVQMDSIKHLDEIQPEIFLNIIKNIQDPDRNIEASEKIDGQNLSFGIDKNDRFFTKTKRSQPVYDASYYDSVEYLIGFKKFHKLFESKRDFLILLRDNIANKLHINNKSDLQIFSELQASAQENTIRYDEDKIGNGAVILFDVKFNGESLLKTEFISKIFNDIIVELNDYEGWKVYLKKIFNINNLQFKLKYVDKLEYILNKYKTIITSRKKSDYILKEKVKKLINLLILNIKKQLIDQILGNNKSMLGNNVIPEGIVLRDFKNNWVTKLVDKDNFSESNQKNHQYNSLLQQILKETSRLIKNEIFGGADILKNFEKLKQKLSDELFVQKQKDSNYKFSDLNDILKIALSDMQDEGRLQLSKNDIISKIKNIITKQLEKINSLQHDLDINDNSKLPEKVKHITTSLFSAAIKKYESLISSELMDNDNVENIYLLIIKFLLGENKIQQLTNFYL